MVDWKKVLAVIAPTLSTALGGPLVGAAVTTIGTALGLPVINEQTVGKALQNLSPDQVVELKKIDQEFQLRMKDLQIDLQSLVIQDRQSARDREISTGDTKTPRMLTLLSMMSFFALIIAVIALVVLYASVKDLGSVPSEIWMLLNGLIGLSGGFCSSSIAYYLGGSSDSSETSRMLYNNTPTEQKLMEAAASALHQSSKSNS